MKPINTKVHGVMDYAMALLLIAAPHFFELDSNAPEGIILYVFGGLLIVYSIVTDYELGLVKVLPMKLHLALDVLSGVVLATSPWLFGFADRVFLPHLALGIIEITAALMTSQKKEDDNRLI